MRSLFFTWLNNLNISSYCYVYMLFAPNKMLQYTDTACSVSENQRAEISNLLRLSVYHLFYNTVYFLSFLVGF